MWSDRRLLDLFGIEQPILLAPMAGAMDAELAIEVARRRARVAAVRHARGRKRASSPHPPRTGRPINLNFFCHRRPSSTTRGGRWRERLQPYYDELGIDPAAPA